MTIVFAVLATARAGEGAQLLACPDSLIEARDAVVRALDDSLSRMHPTARPEWCSSESEIMFLTLGEHWEDDPRARLTRAFVVCAADGGVATWSRVSYFRSWPLALQGDAVEEGARPVRKRLARPHGIQTDGGIFPDSAVEDLISWLDVLGFWETPAEDPQDNGPLHDLGVRVVRARWDGRQNAVVGGDFCSPLPPGISALSGHMLNESDPVAFLAAYRKHLQHRADEVEEQPPAP